MQDFKKLAVWREGQSLALEIYRVTSSFPAQERFGLTSQIRRAATSIPANIAEGCGRGSNAELAHFIQIAIGSSAELESHLLLAIQLGYLSPEAGEQAATAVVRIRRMLTALMTKVRASATGNRKPITGNSPL